MQGQREPRYNDADSECERDQLYYPITCDGEDKSSEKEETPSDFPKCHFFTASQASQSSDVGLGLGTCKHQLFFRSESGVKWTDFACSSACVTIFIILFMVAPTLRAWNLPFPITAIARVFDFLIMPTETGARTSAIAFGAFNLPETITSITLLGMSSLLSLASWADHGFPNLPAMGRLFEDRGLSDVRWALMEAYQAGRNIGRRERGSPGPANRESFS